MVLLSLCLFVSVGGAFIFVFRVRNGILSVMLALAWSLLCVFLTRSFVVDFFVVPTGSMLPTIQLDDHVLGNRIAARLGEYNIGDVVTFDNPDNERVTLIKRVVALEGQEISLFDGKVYVDGQLSATDMFSEGVTEPLSGGVTFPYVVPRGCVFVMGDNREASGDSRLFGPVQKAHVSSVVFSRVFPFDRFGPLDET